MNCKCKGTGRRDGFSEYLDCMEPGCNAASERAEFNQRLKQAGSMSVEDAAWWGRQDALVEAWVSIAETLPPRRRTCYLVYCPENLCLYTAYWDYLEDEDGHYEGKGWFHFQSNAKFDMEISHWMLMPKKPDHPA